MRVHKNSKPTGRVIRKLHFLVQSEKPRIEVESAGRLEMFLFMSVLAWRCALKPDEGREFLKALFVWSHKED